MTQTDTPEAVQSGPGPRWPDVTVVVPTRDRPELLRGTLRAILEQDYPGTVTCLVVHDQSPPDRTVEQAEPGRAVQVVENTRRPGLAGARNTGILAATTELVAFCDDDDVWLPGKLRLQAAALLRHPEAELVCTGIRVRYADHDVPRVLELTSVDQSDLIRSRLLELHPSTFLFRRAALVDRIGLVEEEIPGSYAEDYELLLRASTRPVLNLPLALVDVRWGAQSYFTARWAMIEEALNWLLARYPEFADDPRGHSRVLGQIAFSVAAQGRRRDAVPCAVRALRADPRQPRAWLALAVASGVTTADTVLAQLHRRGRGI